MGKAENDVEKYLDTKVRLFGGVTRKFVSPMHKGVADRLCFLPGENLFIVEVKTYSGSESVPQEKERHLMRSLGFRAFCVYGLEGVDDVIKIIKGGSYVKNKRNK